jgi:predicted acyltransferase (DUF342 family)
MIRTRKVKKIKPIIVDKGRGVIIIRKRTVLDREISFRGKIIVGMDSCLWKRVECEEILVGKASFLKEEVRCRKAIIGANTEFNSIIGDEITIQNGCRGRRVSGKKVIVRKNVRIEHLEADTAYIDGISRLGSVNVKRVVALKSE